jgi:hypothetical protein
MNAKRELRLDCRLRERQWLLMIRYVLIALTGISGTENARCGTGRAFFSGVKTQEPDDNFGGARKGFSGAGIPRMRRLVPRKATDFVTFDNDYCQFRLRFYHLSP